MPRKTDYMDVDQAQLRALSVEERKKLLKEKLCFYCRKPGHVTKNCRKRLAKERQDEASIKKNEAEEAIQTQRSEVDEIVARMRGMNDDMKNSIHDQLTVDELGFH